MNTMEFHEDKTIKYLPSEYQEKIVTIHFPPNTFLDMINADKSIRENYMRLGEQSMINFLFRTFFMGQMLLWMLAEMQPHWEEEEEKKT